MSFTDMIREKVMVDGTEVYVPKETTAQELMQYAGKDPNSRDLVKEDLDGTTSIYQKSRRIACKEGDRFQTQLSGRNGN